MSLAENIVKQIIKQHFSSANDLSMALRKLYNAEHSQPLPKSTLISAYRQLLKNGQIKPSKKLEKLFTKRAVRTLSGVSVITVLTKPFMCPGKCVYCPTEPNMPKSYLSNEPAAQRAVRNNFDPFDQVQNRIKALENNGHEVDKIEILVLGGTWSAYDREYQEWFVTQLFYAANVYSGTSDLSLGARDSSELQAASRESQSLLEE
ncbi:MAG: hypothetical protein V1846_00080 [Candidatus Komeilibacteria bacterium]